MASVLKCDCSVADAYVAKTGIDPFATPWWATYQVAIPSSTATALNGISADRSAALHYLRDAANLTTDEIVAKPEVDGTGPWDIWASLGSIYFGVTFAVDTWQTVQLGWDGTTLTVTVNGVDVNSYTWGTSPEELDVGGRLANVVVGEVYYIKSAVIGSTSGGSDLFSDGFGGGDLSAWSATTGDVSLVADPGFTGGGGGGGGGATAGRVGIAFDDGPLVASPTWTFIDQGGDVFPQNFVSGYDIETGRQTLLSQTDTGTATVYVYDHELALFDPRNVGSPYFGKLDGKQILLQLHDPVADAWEPQFRGLIDDITWEIDGSAVDPDGKPINATIQIECVDMFDYLAGYGLTPGLNGVTPPAGAEDGVYYAETTGTVDDRIIEILADVAIDPDRYIVASGNVSVRAVKYDPDESALQALRDAADAELPFIANIYCDRVGRFLFRGRYSRFDPDDTSAEAGSDWDFTRWSAGDGLALELDPTRAQIRTFAFSRPRSDLVNVAIAYPQDIEPADMPNQVFADTTSITDFGKHSAPPMSDLLTDQGSASPSGFTTTANRECFLFAKLLVLNQKDPRESITTLGFKAMRPDGTPRAEQTWALLTKADISHIVNVSVGYPAGTGLAGDSPQDDYYIEGRRMQVRPLNPTHDYVELELAVSPAVWSMDTHGVFEPFPGPGLDSSPALTADFLVSS